MLWMSGHCMALTSIAKYSHTIKTGIIIGRILLHVVFR